MPDSDLGVYVAKLAADVSDLKQGLAQGRRDFQTFQGLIETGAAKITQVLAFAGVTVGLGALLTKVKEFGASILSEGGKTEVLRQAAYAIAQNYQVSAGAIDFYIQRLKQAGIEEQRSFQGINAFLKAGLSIDYLPQLAEAAKGLGKSMAMGPQEAFSTLIEGIVKGTPKQLAEMVPGIKQAMAALTSESGKAIDAMLTTGPERSQMMLDLVLQGFARVKGVGEATADSYMTKLAQQKLKIVEVKEALFELVKPIGMAITGENLKNWESFYDAIAKNKAALRDLGVTLSVSVQNTAEGVRTWTAWIAQYKELAKVLLEIYGITKILKWTGLAEGAVAAAGAVGSLSTRLAVLRASLSVPWGLVIAVTVVGLMEAAKAIDRVVKRQPSVGTSMLMGEAEFVQTDQDRAARHTQDKAAEEAAKTKAFIEAHKGKDRGPVSAFGGLFPGPLSPDQAKKEAEQAAKLGQDLAPKVPKGGGGKGAAGAGSQEDIFGLYLKMLEQQRQAEVQAAQNSLDLLRSTNEQKRAELEQALAAGLIDGQQYYQKLQALNQQETAKALELIAIKRQAEDKAHADALADLDRQPLSEAAKNYQVQTEAAKHNMALAQLAAEAAKAKLDGEVRVTNELKRQAELAKQYQGTSEGMEIETAQLLGAVSQQEAALMKLNLDWKNNRAAALNAGLAPDNLYFAALDKNLEAKKLDTQYGGYVTQITQGFSSLMDTLSQGGQQLQQAAHNIFKGFFDEGLKPGLEQLGNLLKKGFKDLFGEAGSGLASAVMGGIGLIGMLATSGGESSWSPSGVTSAVTAHEAVRGLIAGPDSIPIAEIGVSFQDALVETNGILLDIERNTRGSGAGGSGNGVFPNLDESIRQALDRYFADNLQLGRTF